MSDSGIFSSIFKFRGSLGKRLNRAFTTILVILLIPVLVSMSMMLYYSRSYHSLIDRADKVSSLQPVVTEDLPNELFGIIAGRSSFIEGSQFDILSYIQQEIDDLIAQKPASLMELTVASRTARETLKSYIDNLGEQMAQGSRVEQNLELLEEIRNVSALLGDMLRDALRAEILSATQTSQGLQTTLYGLLALDTALVLFSLLFIRKSRKALETAVTEPVEELKRFAGEIALGRLDARANEPDMEELHSLNSSLNTMAGQLKSLMEENRLEQENLKKSEMRALQAQITPHFLYNSLDAIVWLAEAKRTAEVVAITRALSDFYRISLSDGRDWISVAQEEGHLRGYLTIQQIRYRDILDYEINIAPNVRDEMILKLSIQPLAENALYHGIKNRRGRGKLEINVFGDEEQLCVEVRDNGLGMSEERLQQVRDLLAGRGNETDIGYGLFSVDKRLKLYYGQSRGLDIESSQDKGTTISFRVPLKQMRNEHV
ncbi:MAG: sensor histidine kinase [Clostridiales bacterium]|nr:sensor histidine kinase [Clostridiales bacterium]